MVWRKGQKGSSEMAAVNVMSCLEDFRGNLQLSEIIAGSGNLCVMARIGMWSNTPSLLPVQAHIPSASGSGTSRVAPFRPVAISVGNPSVTDADGDGTPGAKGQRILALPTRSKFHCRNVIDK